MPLCPPFSLRMPRWRPHFAGHDARSAFIKLHRDDFSSSAMSGTPRLFQKSSHFREESISERPPIREFSIHQERNSTRRTGLGAAALQGRGGERPRSRVPRNKGRSWAAVIVLGRWDFEGWDLQVEHLEPVCPNLPQGISHRHEQSRFK